MLLQTLLAQVERFIDLGTGDGRQVATTRALRPPEKPMSRQRIR
jgi:hypothetical protein